MKVIFKQYMLKGTPEEYSYLFEVVLSDISIYEFTRRYGYNNNIELIKYVSIGG